jgi:hypothetical protein
LYAQKPELENWIIMKFRQRRSDFFNLEIEGVKLSTEDVYYKLFKDDEKIGILVFIEKYNENVDLYKNVAFIFLDSILGEYDMETKVGAIEILDFTSEYFPGSLPFNTLAEDFDTAYEDSTDA